LGPESSKEFQFFKLTGEEDFVIYYGGEKKSHEMKLNLGEILGDLDTVKIIELTEIGQAFKGQVEVYFKKIASVVNINHQNGKRSLSKRSGRHSYKMPSLKIKKSIGYVDIKETDQYGYLRRIREADSPVKMMLETEKDPLRFDFANRNTKSGSLNFLSRETLKTKERFDHLGLQEDAIQSIWDYK